MCTSFYTRAIVIVAVLRDAYVVTARAQPRRVAIVANLEFLKSRNRPPPILLPLSELYVSGMQRKHFKGVRSVDRILEDPANVCLIL